MANQFFENLFLNPPYGFPNRYWELDITVQSIQQIGRHRATARIRTALGGIGAYEASVRLIREHYLAPRAADVLSAEVVNSLHDDQLRKSVGRAKAALLRQKTKGAVCFSISTGESQ